jgi:hypothetical protein
MPRVPLFLLLLVMLFAPACAGLTPIDPGAMTDPDDISAGVAPLPSRELMEYSGTWAGIPAGEAVIYYERRGDVFLSRARIGTIGLVALLYGVTLVAEAESSVTDYLSRRWSYETKGADPDKRTTVRYAPETGKVISVIRQEGEVENLMLDAPGALDPLGLVIAVRRSTMKTGQSFVTDLFTERNIYVASTLVMERERIRTPLGEYDAVLVRTDIHRVKDGGTPDRARGLGIWFTDDEYRIPVRIDVDTKFGRVRLGLSRYERGWPRVSSGRGTPADD